MTVENTNSTISYTGNSSVTTFAYNFLTYSTEHLFIYFDDVLQTSGFTITGIGDDNGGDVTFVSPPITGVTIRIDRTVPDTQLLAYQEYGPFPAKANERGLDLLTMAVQQTSRNFNRGKMDKRPLAAEDNIIVFDDTGNSKDSGFPVFDGEAKMDRIPNASIGNFVTFDSNGNSANSGINTTSFFNKMDKAPTSNIDNVVIFDSAGNAKDSGKKLNEVGNGGSYIGENPPTFPQQGDRWTRCTDMKGFIYYIDADSAQWIEDRPSYEITDTIGDVAQTYIFDTVAAFKASLIEFPNGKTIHLNDRDADFIKISGVGTDNGANIISSASANQSISYIVNGEVDAKHLGILTSSSDISSAFGWMQSLGAATVMESGTYKALSPLVFLEDSRARNGRVVIDLDGLPAASVGGSCTLEKDIIGFDFDGANTVTMTAGFQHTLEFTPTRKLKSDVICRNITNTDNTSPCYGVLYVVGGAAANTSIYLESTAEGHNITATANAVIGDTGGKAAGVHLSVNKSGMINNVVMLDNKASKIYPQEDGDGIHVFDVDQSDLFSKSSYRIVRPVVWDCSKRGIKAQAPNCVTLFPFINIDLNDGDSTGANAYHSLGVNNKLINPIVIGSQTVSNSDGSIVCSAENFTLIEPTIKVAAGQNLIRMETGAKNYKVSGGTIESIEAYANPDFSMVLIEGAASGVCEMDKISNLAKTGSVVRYLGVTGKNTLEINNECLGGHLVRYSFCTGEFFITEAYGDLSDEIINEDGDSGEYTVNNVYAITTANSAVTTKAAMKFRSKGRLESVTNGILYTGTVDITGREVSGDWELVASAGTGTGIDANSTINGKFTGVETTGFATHVKYNFSDKMLVRDLLTRGAGTPISNTGVTNSVEYNNNVIV